MIKQVEIIIECPICKDKFHQPKILPCFHTFCLQCIEQCCHDGTEDNVMPCPMCREQFKVPTGGLSMLRANIDIERLIAAHSDSKMGVGGIAYCYLCMATSQRKVAASSSCMECQENLCEQCSNNHTIKFITHRPVSLESDQNIDTNIKFKSKFCNVHSTEEILFYCHDCKVSFCKKCFETHYKHDIETIDCIASKFKNKVRKYLDAVNKLKKDINERSKNVNEQMESFTHSVAIVEELIITRGEEVNRIVDKHRSDLLSQLNFIKTSILGKIQKTHDELQSDRMSWDNFQQSCLNVLREQNSAEVVCVSDILKIKAKALEVWSIPELGELPQIEFSPSQFDVTMNQSNIVGKLVGEYLEVKVDRALDHHDCYSSVC